ncbi:Putative tRNA (cytidine(34)-2'-O)-methyltransferase [Halomicronema hongdechloris C2206]|uniref:Putative tRNA (cytidine(34)-2'-O)-methyltransferase n=1 Tax=Halomicronema hongdechloris C2206 TaxID=1641165 RepID=A0A1Z3HSV5_9CYAN|nr:tRNA (cytidine(34)-2'-O)-methyltransferase [Halomicronema hongdechloris]ASC73401.1 Putative tRNA (cytidine(34)-2'-O)-methyltransferase [Halomicronema hongdechloris C2206]
MPRVVLVNPQIPPNTGNIARTCAAMAQELHLIKPLGFELSDRYLKRAGLDYWPHVSLKVHEDWDSFAHHRDQRGGRWIGFSTSGEQSYITFEFHQDDWLLFGAETTGLSRTVLARCDRTLHIPMIQPQVRSLNLSVSVTIGLFEALRQLNQIQ